MNLKWRMLFPGGKEKALTLSYDDGTIHDRRLVEIMNRNGIRGTFNLNSGTFNRKETADFGGIQTNISTISGEEVHTLYKGHEVASHTVHHPAITGIASTSVLTEVLEDRRELERLSNGLVRGFAYPYGSYSKNAEEMLAFCGIEYARTVISTGRFELPEQFLEWHPTCHHNDPELMKLSKDFCEKKPWSSIIFYLWGHSYEFEQVHNWEVIEEFCSYMSKYKEDLWMAANIEISDYVKAYDRIRWSVDGSKVENPCAVDLWITDGKQKVCLKPGAVTKLSFAV